MTNQEMFDKAWAGLKAQNWEPAMRGLSCTYYVERDGCVLRCAWGHVDPDGTRGRSGSVNCLRDAGIGIAADIPHEQVEFAQRLQDAHDAEGIAGGPERYSPAYIAGRHAWTLSTNMEERMRALAAHYDLQVPE